MATYCQAGERAKLLINGETIGTYTAPIDVVIGFTEESSGYEIAGGWYLFVRIRLSWVACEYSSNIWTFKGIDRTTGYASFEEVLDKAKASGGLGSGKPNPWSIVQTGTNTACGGLRKIFTFDGTGPFSSCDSAENIYLPPETVPGTYTWSTEVTDGNGTIVHEATHDSEPTIEVQCSEALSEDEWRDKYQTENCDDLRECLECIDLALSQLPF